jgi:hypothetical protein
MTRPILPFSGIAHLPSRDLLEGHVRGFGTNRDETAALLQYGIPERHVFTRGIGAEELEPCLATYRGRAGWLILARDLRAFGGTKRQVADRTDALETAKIRVLDISHPEDRTYSALVQRANVAISGARFGNDRRKARRQGRAGGLRRGALAHEYREGVTNRWLVDRIVDHRDIPWVLKVDLLHPHFSESTLRRHYGANATIKPA